MPPVFGPASSSSARLKSWAGCSGTTVVPSVMANRLTSGPSRNSSITTRPQDAAWSSGDLAVGGHHDPLAGGETVVLDHVRRPELVQRGGHLLGGLAQPRGRGRHPGGGHHVLGEGLAALELGGGRRTGRSRRSRRRGRRRPPRPPAAPRGRPRPGRRRARVARAATAAGSVGRHGWLGPHLPGPGIAGGGVHLDHRRVAGERQREGVLATAGADDEDAEAPGGIGGWIRSGAGTRAAYRAAGPGQAIEIRLRA